MDKKTLTKINAYARAVKDQLDVKKIILFGSYAKGNQRTDSDIDIAIILKHNFDFFEVNMKLQRLKNEIDSRIEPVALTDEQDPSGFLQHILKEGKTIPL